MNIKDCRIGDRVLIAGKYLITNLYGEGEIVEIVIPQDNYENPAYPYGMVKIRLSGSISWSCREPWFGPEDLMLIDKLPPWAISTPTQEDHQPPE